MVKYRDHVSYGGLRPIYRHRDIGRCPIVTQPTIGRYLVEYRPIAHLMMLMVSVNVSTVILSVVCRPKSVIYRSTVGQVSFDYPSIYGSIHRPILDRFPVEYRPSIGRVSTDISTNIPLDIPVDIPIGEQGWRSGESARLPPMCPGFDSRTRRHMWTGFVGSLLCSERFFSGNSGFPLSTTTNI